MKVLLLNDLKEVSNSVPEDEAPVWSATTTYTQGQRCIYNHYIYASLGDGNKGHSPALSNIGVSAKWQKVKGTNHWAMFDGVNGTRTVTAENVEDLTVTLPFNRATGWAAFNMDCSGLIASAYDVDSDTPYWTREYDLLHDRRGRWRYRYEESRWIRDITETGIIDLTTRGRLVLQFRRMGGRCAVGSVVAGRAHFVGLTQFNVEPSVKSYSSVTEDVFGNTTIVERFSTKNIRASLYVHPLELDPIFSFLKDIINKPAVWMCDNDDKPRLECLTTYGYLRSVSAPIKGPNECILPIEIMGMI